MRARIRQPHPSQGQKVRLPNLNNTERPDECHPVFSFEYLNKDYDVDSCTKDERAALCSKLAKLSKMTWTQIKQSPRHGLGFEKISRNSIKSGIPAAVTPEVDLLAFRFCDLKPMVGFRVESVFFIVWLDRDFSLYDHS